MKILAVKLRAIGDTVIWTSALQALRQAYPQAEIHALSYAPNAAVLEHHPAINVAHYLPAKSNTALARTLMRFRRERFDWLLGFHATTSLCRWAWLAGAARMALHHHSWRRTPSGSVPLPNAGELEDAITRDLHVLEAMGVAEPGRPPTHIHLTALEAEMAERRMREAIEAIGGHPGLARFIFLPGAGHHLRRYPKDLWLPLAEQMRGEGRYQPIVIVDQTLSRELELRRECDARRLPLIDQGSLREFMGLVSRGKRALTNDSGPGHIAVALGLKTSFVFGPGCVGDWHPYDKGEHPLYRVAVPCRAEGPRDREEFQFCTVDQCEHHSCLRKIDLKVPELTSI